jgi:hypothetical protein
VCSQCETLPLHFGVGGRHGGENEDSTVGPEHPVLFL